MINRWDEFINENTQSGTQSDNRNKTPQGGVAYATKGGGMGAIRSAKVNEGFEVNESNLILEEGDGGGGAAAGGDGGGGAAGSGDVSAGTTPVSTSGVAYVNQGNVSGMGDVKNATVSPTPGDPDGSEPGSGDVSVSIPAFTFTKGTGITGNRFTKMGNTKVKKKDLFQTVTKAKDKFGVSKTMSFQEFSNKQL